MPIELASLLASTEELGRTGYRLPSAYKDLSPEQCLKVLEAQRGTLSEKTLSIAGVDIPLSFVIRWGQLVLLCAIAYLVVHSLEARQRLSCSRFDPGWQVPWLPLYASRSARCLTWLTAVALPLWVGGLSLFQSWPASGGYDRAVAIAISIAVLVAAIGVWLILRSITAQARSHILSPVQSHF